MLAAGPRAVRQTGSVSETPATTGRPTVAEVLALPAVRRGRPEVVAGAAGLDRRVRWAHVSDLADIAGLLRGGEVVLTTGLGLPDDEDELSRYVGDLDRVGAAALVVELGRRFRDRLPTALVTAAEGRRLPLVVLRQEARFVAITEAVHSRILDAQLAELQASERLHAIFTELSVGGAGPTEVLRQAAMLAGGPAVLENLAHRVLVYDAAGADDDELLADWENRSRALTCTARTQWHPGEGWLVSTVGARGEDWGRLVLVLPQEPDSRQVMLAERAAGALALDRLLQRDREGLERQAHRALLEALRTQAWPTREAGARARALGVPLEGRRLAGVVVRPTGPGGVPALEAVQRLRDLAERATLALRSRRLIGLVAPVDDRGVGVLLSFSHAEDVERGVELLARSLRAGPGTPVLVAAGSTVTALDQVRRSFLEAATVADSVDEEAASRASLVVHRLEDVGLAGLLHLLRDDPRLQTFVERELGALLAHEPGGDGDLSRTLRTYLDAGRNKSAAATGAHLSRPALYERLHRLEQLLAVDLDDPRTAVTLHVALLALDAVRRP